MYSVCIVIEGMPEYKQAELIKVIASKYNLYRLLVPYNVYLYGELCYEDIKSIQKEIEQLDMIYRIERG